MGWAGAQLPALASVSPCEMGAGGWGSGSLLMHKAQPECFLLEEGKTYRPTLYADLALHSNCHFKLSSEKKVFYFT